MLKSVRHTVSALLIVATLVVLAVPVAAAPRAEPISESTVPGLRLVIELWAWAGAWLGELPIEKMWAPGGASVDPNGQPATTGDPVTGTGSTERAGGEEVRHPAG